MQTNTTFDKNLRAINNGATIVVNQGGTSSGKTWGLLQLLTVMADKTPGWILSVVSESMPHLKKGAMRDFFNILGDSYNPAAHNKSDHTYKIGTSTIEFFSADEVGKVRGPRRNVLFLNECINVPYETYDQLEIRTADYIFLDYNPCFEFWVHQKVLPRAGVEFIKSTYLDNKYLPQSIKDRIEARRGIDPGWWRVYGLGEIGQMEGVIFTNWDQVKEYPKEYQWQVYGQDFGFTNDPSAMIRVCLSGGELWMDEVMYDYGLTNHDIADRYRQLNISRRDVIYGDAAEPKSIEEIYREGYNIKPAPKGQDSIRAGINLLKKYRINVTQTSVNLIKELRNYRWQEDKNGNLLNVPIDGFNHAIDAIRYAVSGQMQQGGNILIAKML